MHTSSVPSFNDPKPNAMWYLKQDGQSTADDSAQNELARLKQLEQDMMLEALGLKPKGSAAAAAAQKRPLQPHELAAVLKRTPADGNSDVGGATDAANVGLGAAIGARSALGTFGVPESIEGVDLPPDHALRMQQATQRAEAHDAEAAASAAGATTEASSSRREKHRHHRRKHKEANKDRRKKRKKKSKRSESGSRSSSSESSAPRRRRHDSESDDRHDRRRGGRHDSDESDERTRRRRRHDSDSERSRSRSRSPRR